MEARGFREWIGVMEEMLKASVFLFCFPADFAGVVAEVEVAEVEAGVEEETKTVDVIVPYTVRFLYTVSGRNVTVASLLAVRSNTSVVWISCH